MTELVQMAVVDERDVFTVRHLGREIAARVGFDEPDQVRIATALSEIGRELLGPEGDGRIVVGVDAPSGLLTVSATSSRALPMGSAPAGLAGAARLMDAVEVAEVDGGTLVRLAKAIPVAADGAIGDLEALAGELAASGLVSPLDELRAQNHELLRALDELREREQELLRLNAELDETNRGVMAMYAQLSDELDETNRGVVALYGELDAKTVELERANEAKSRFLASVSHELRTPVNSMIALSRLLAEPAGEPLSAEQRQQVALLASSAQDLRGLVNELLDLAKAESGRLEPHLQPADLAPLLAELRSTIRPLLEPGVVLEVDVADDLPLVETDPVLLSQVLRNLLSNAAKFTERGTIRLAARRASRPQGIELEVSDTGIGIAPEDRERIFEEFFQVRGPLQARRRGSGLGLAYVRRVVEALGGTLELTSEVGRGTSVRVGLAGSCPSAGPGRPVAGEVHVGTALVVDDDPAFRAALRSMLEEVAGRVLEAGGGLEGLSAAAAAAPEVVFLDVRMPDLEAGDVLERMAADPSLAGVPVVVVTSLGAHELADARLERARALLAKSDLDAGTLRAVLADIVAEARP